MVVQIDWARSTRWSQRFVADYNVRREGFIHVFACDHRYGSGHEPFTVPLGLNPLSFQVLPEVLLDVAVLVRERL